MNDHRQRATEIALEHLKKVSPSEDNNPAPWVVDAIDQALGEAIFGSPGMADAIPTEPAPESPQVWCFTLLMAEVIFNCDLGIQTRRIQFVSKSDGETFPRSRLLQLQKIAATNVVAEVKEQSGGVIVVKSVEAVYLLGTIPLGWMTEEEFLLSETTLVSTGEIGKEDNAPSETTPPPVSATVIAFPTPN